MPKKPGIRQELETLAAELQHMNRLKQEQHWIQAEQSENLKAWAAAL